MSTAIVWGVSPKQSDHREHAWILSRDIDDSPMAFALCDESVPAFEKEIVSSNGAELRCEVCESKARQLQAVGSWWTRR